ncbi:MAG TPA: TonB family protein, partial [Chthoniobacterales bacterium]
MTDFPNSPREEPDLVTPPEQFPVNEEFSEENATRLPIHPRKKMPVSALSRSTGIGTARTMGFGSAKALTLFAPKPNYPYEARRGGITGTGVAQLKVNTGAGSVIDARMSQSTGSAILDNATLGTLRRWRFRPGVAEN